MVGLNLAAAHVRSEHPLDFLAALAGDVDQALGVVHVPCGLLQEFFVMRLESPCGAMGLEGMNAQPGEQPLTHVDG